MEWRDDSGSSFIFLNRVMKCLCNAKHETHACPQLIGEDCKRCKHSNCSCSLANTLTLRKHCIGKVANVEFEWIGRMLPILKARKPFIESATQVGNLPYIRSSLVKHIFIK